MRFNKQKRVVNKQQQTEDFMDKQQMKLHQQKLIFVITGGDYLRDSSGTSKVVKAHEDVFVHAGYEYMVMFPVSLSRGNGVKRKTITTGCYGLIVDGVFIGIFTPNQVLRYLSDQQNAGKEIAGVLIHHIIRSRINVIRYIVEQIENVRVVYYLHDFYTCCLNYNLLRNDEISCVGMIDMCKGCSYEKLRKKHMAEIADLFRAFENRLVFVAPSAYVKNQWVKYYPQYSEKVVVIAHQKFEGQYVGNRNSLSYASKIRIGYVGSQTKPKGWEIWKDILSKLPNAKEDYDFFYFGNGLEEIEGMNKVYVEIHRQGKDAMIQALRDKQIDVVLLGSVCGETYSYTLYEAHAANCFVLAMKSSGNIAYTVQHENWGRVFNSSEEIISILYDKKSVVELLNEWNQEVAPGTMLCRDNDDILMLFEHICNGAIDTGHLHANIASNVIRCLLSRIYYWVRESGNK